MAQSPSQELTRGAHLKSANYAQAGRAATQAATAKSVRIMVAFILLLHSLVAKEAGPVQHATVLLQRSNV